MTKRPQRSADSAPSICVEDLRRFAQGWTLDGEYRRPSPTTTEKRQIVLGYFSWWLNHKDLKIWGGQEIKGCHQGVTHVSGTGFAEP